MSLSAMKQALEALETLNSGDSYKTHNAATALRQAIEFEEMVKKGTKAWTDTPDDWVDDLRGGIESCTKVGTKSGVFPTEWIGLDKETMRNTTLQFNQGALWAERYLKEKNG
jgi:hypothetical protein